MSYSLSIVKVKKGEKKAIIQRKLDQLDYSEKGLNAKQYCGKIKLQEDPLEYQKKMRDEWE